MVPWAAPVLNKGVHLKARDVQILAKRNGWSESANCRHHKLLVFKKDDMMVEVWLMTGTVTAFLRSQSSKKDHKKKNMAFVREVMSSTPHRFRDRFCHSRFVRLRK